MKNSVSLLIAILFSVFWQEGNCDALNINALGCEIKLPDVQSVSVSPPDNVSFLFNDSHSGLLAIAVVTKYPGDNAWYEKDTSKTSRVHKNFHGLDDVVITVKQNISMPLVYHGLTDKKNVIYFKNTNPNLDNYVTCQK